MTLEQIILYPLTHRMVTEAALDGLARRIEILSNQYARPVDYANKQALALPAPAKAKRHYSRKAAAEKVQS
jgi:hypothetical protein